VHKINISKLKIKASRVLSKDDGIFNGHFPGTPVMPGVLLVEAMAQVGGILLLDAEQDTSNKLVFFTGIDKVKFRKTVVPGDQLRFEVEMLRYRLSICKMAGKGYIGDELAVEAELSAAVVEK
jgi:3-hydroxymyristoyl/3-hydroxydecanoyl-(acyl carrier protein) dehydratase